MKMPNSFRFRTLERMNKRNSIGGGSSRWELMPLLGKEARRRVTEGKKTPKSGV